MLRRTLDGSGATRALPLRAALALVILVLAGCAGSSMEPTAPGPTTQAALVETPPTPSPLPVLEPAISLWAAELSKAGELAAASQVEDAVSLYEGLASADPRDARPEIGWAWAMIYDGEPGLAVPHARSAVALDPESSDAWAVLSRAYAGTGDAAGAMHSALQACALDIGSAQARAALGEAHLLLGETLQALRASERAVALGKTNADAHRLRARVFFEVEHQPERASSELQAAAAYQPQLWLRRYELGRMLLEAGYAGMAALAFEDALALRPEAVSYAGLGAASYGLKQYDQAREALDQAVLMGLEDPSVYGTLAASYAQLGQCGDADRAASQALALEPAQEGALEARDLCGGAAQAPQTEVPTSTPVAVTPAPSPAVKALRGRIAYPLWNAATGIYEVYSAQAEDGSARTLVIGGMHQPALSPDGLWLAANGQRPNYELLCLVRTDGSGLVEISAYAEDGQPSWSPDGRALIYASFRHGVDRQPRMYSLDGIPWEGAKVDGREISTGLDAVRGEMPAWIADGRIVYRGCGLDSPAYGCSGQGLRLVPGTPGAVTPTPLTDHPGDSQPAVHGSRIAFMGDRDGDWELYLIEIDGTGLKQLTSNGASDGLPEWSPDGRTLAFVSDQGGSWGVWAVEPDDGDRQKLFDLGGELGPDWIREQISWSP